MSSNPTTTETIGAPKPKMGGKRSEKMIWTGGIPKADWSSLETETTRPFCIHCHRFPNEPFHEAEADIRRTTPPKGIRIKAITPDLYYVKSRLLMHTREYGLDTIFYVPDREDSSKVVNVLQEHSRLSLEYVKEHIQVLKSSLWDSYDHDNDSSAKRLLLNSLDKDFAIKLQVYQFSESMSAAELWITIVRTIMHNSEGRFHQLREKLCEMTPRKIPGQNIMIYCKEAWQIILELIEARQWQWTLLLKVVKGLTQATDPIFRGEFLLVLVKVDQLFKKIFCYTDEVIEKHLKDSGCHWTDILQRAEDSYRSLYMYGDWKPT